jgi:hypothetical protein
MHPGAGNRIQGQANLIDAFDGITTDQSVVGRQYALGERLATLLVAAQKT